MSENCVGCKHWKPLDRAPHDARTDMFGVEPAPREHAPWGECGAVESGQPSDEADAGFYVVDCEEFLAALITKPTFGCSEFEAVSG